MEGRMCQRKAWELHKEVFELKGSYDKNETKFHVIHSVPSWLKKKRAHVDESSPEVAATRGHSWEKLKRLSKGIQLEARWECAGRSSLTVALPNT